MAGVPWTPVSPPYSLVSVDYDKLKHVLRTVTPGLVFAQDARYAKAIAATVGDDMDIVMAEGGVDGRQVSSFVELCATPVTDAVDKAMATTGPDTIIKFLFTSGSTKLPKAVINTNRMWCANQQQMTQSMPVLLEEPLVLVDWLPWNHTFGGNHNVGLTLFHGGSLYIDDGKPVPALFGETLRNLREVAPTIYFNVPKGFEALKTFINDSRDYDTFEQQREGIAERSARIARGAASRRLRRSRRWIHAPARPALRRWWRLPATARRRCIDLLRLEEVPGAPGRDHRRRLGLRRGRRGVLVPRQHHLGPDQQHLRVADLLVPADPRVQHHQHRADPRRPHDRGRDRKSVV